MVTISFTLVDFAISHEICIFFQSYLRLSTTSSFLMNDPVALNCLITQLTLL